jgi:DNA polymerase III subunit chi
MGAAYFYLLTESSVEQTLPTLISRAQGQGWQIELRGVDAGRMEALDQALWLGPEDSFLAHGLAGGAQDALQPVLLTTAQTDRACIMCVDGADVTPEQVQAAQRVCVLFDGNDQAALTGARAQWKALTGAGCAAQYWAQDNGRWVMKAEAAPPSAP